MSSNNVDNRVVNMQFNNAQFEAGVSKTMSSLENLKQSLQFKNATNGLEQVQGAVNGFSFSNIESSITALENRFSTLGIVGMTAISDITTKVINLGETIASKVVNQIKEGGTTRYKNIAQAKFMIEGLGKDWNALYEDMDYAVTGTAYGIDEAAKAASSLSASGIEAGDDMKAALRGISGTAAMTNSDFSSMADIFTTVAGQGKLMTMQLRQFESRGLNVAATLADYLGTTEASVREMVTQGTIDFETFSTAMDSAFGEHATKANETFSGALSNMKAALSRIGENFSRPIYERLIGPLNDVRELFDKVKNKLTDLTGTLSGGNWYNSPFGTFIGALSNKLRTLIQNIDLSWFDTFVDYLIKASEFGTYFVTHYDGVINTIKSFIDETNAVPTDKYKSIMTILTGFSNVGKAIKNVFNSVSLIIQTIVAAFREAFNLGDASDGFLSLTEILLNVSQALAFTEDDATKLKPILVDVFNVIKTIVDGIISFTSTLSTYLGPIFSKLFDYMVEFYDIGSDIINDVIDSFNGNESLTDFMTTITSVFDGSSSAVDNFSNVFSSAIGFLKNVDPKTWGLAALSVIIFNLTKNFSSFGFAIKRVTSLVNNVATVGNTFSNIMKGLAYYSRSVATVAVIKEIAIAIVALAASLALLTLVDSAKLTTATKCLAALIGVIAVFAVSMTLLTSKIQNVLKVGHYFTTLGLLFVAMSASILILTVALSKLSNIDTTSIWKNFAVLSLIFAELVAATILLSTVTPVLTKGAISLVFYAASVYILVSAFNSLASVKLDNISEKLVALGLVMLTIIGVAKIANGISFGAPVGLLATIASIWLVEKMLNYIVKEGLDFKSLKDNLDKILIAIGSMIAVTIMMKVLSSTGNGAIKAAVTIAIIAYSIQIIAESLNSVANAAVTGNLGTAINALIVIFAGIISLLYIITSGGKTVRRAGSTILLISVAIAIISAALKGLSDIKNVDGLWNSVAAISLLLVDILAIMGIISKLAIKINIGSILSMAILISAIGISLTLLTKIGDTTKALEAAGAIGLVLLAMATAVAILSKFTKFLDVSALASLYGMIILLVAISASLLLISSIKNMDKVYDSVAAISLVTMVLASAFVAISRYSKSIMPNTLILLGDMITLLVAVAASLTLLTQYGDMDKVYDAVAAISLVIAVVTSCFIAISAFTSHMNVPSIIGLGIMVIALLSVAASLRLLLDGGYDWNAMWSAAKTLIAVLSTVVVALSLLSVVSYLTGNIGLIVAGAALVAVILSLSVAMNMFGKMVNSLVKSIESLSKIDYDSINIEVLTQLVWVLAKLGLVSSLVGVGFVVLGVSLLTIGAGLTVVSLAVTILVAAFSKFVVATKTLVASLTTLGMMAPIIATGIRAIGVAVAETLVNIAIALALGISNFITTLASNSTKIKESLSTLLTAVIELVFEGTNTIVKAIADGFIDLLTILEEKAPIISEKLISTIVQVLKSVAQYSAVIGFYGAVIAIGFISGVINGLLAMVPTLAKTLRTLAISAVISFADAIEDFGPILADSIKVLFLAAAKGAGDFVNELLGVDVFDTDTIAGELDYQKDVLKSKTEEAGEEMAEAEAEGFSSTMDEKASGMNKSSEKAVSNAADQTQVAKTNSQKTGNTIVDTISDTVSNGGGKILGSMTDMLSESTDGGGLFDSGYDMFSSYTGGAEQAADDSIVNLSGYPSEVAAQMKKKYEAEGYVFEDAGGYIGKKTEDGLNDYDVDLSQFNDTVTNNIGGDPDELTAQGTEDKDYYIGGLVNISEEDLQKVREAYARIGHEAHEATVSPEGLDEQSPSKKAEKASLYYGQGLVNGMTKSMGSVTQAATSLSNGITNTVEQAFNKASLYSDQYVMAPTISPVVDGNSVQTVNDTLNSLLDNRTSLDLATDSALSIKDASAYNLATQVAELSAQVKKLADTDYSKMLDGVSINVDASTNVDGTPLRKMASNYTIKQIDAQQSNYNMSRGARA